MILRLVRRWLGIVWLVGIRKVGLDPEIAVFLPAKVELEPPALIREIRQQNDPAPGYREVPAAIRVGGFIWIPAAPHRFLVGDADDVKIKIVERVAAAPQPLPVFCFRAI